MPKMEWNSKIKKWSKTCAVCSTEYLVDGNTWDIAYVNMRKYFTTHFTGSADRLQSFCKECNNNKSNGRISKFSKKELYDQQNGLCAICCKATNIEHLRVDHDHKTREGRGLLCNRCNTMMHGVDDPIWLESAIAYRDKYTKDCR